MRVPDTLSTSMTWAIMEETGLTKLLDSVLEQMYPGGFFQKREGVWEKCVDREYEWSGPGSYRLQVRLNRPEGRPLYSLKWEGPL